MATARRIARKDSSHQKCVSCSTRNEGATGKKQSDVHTVERVKELESQVSELKKRLNNLRKAKGQTIVKKDKEYVSFDTPKLGPQFQGEQGAFHQLSIKESQEETRKRTHVKEIIELKDEIRKLKLSHSKELLKNESKERFVGESEELIELRKKCQGLQEKNDSLEALCTEQNMRINELCESLSQKEVDWCNKEEKLKVELKLSWREKYQQWMAQTEQKIEELQAANQFLKTLIQRDRDRSTPT